MSNLILLFVCLGVGMLLRRVKGLPDGAYLVLNTFLLNVCLPALTLLYTVEITLTPTAFLPVAVSWILYPISFLFFRLLAPILHLDRATTGVLTMTAGISSISFVGFPIFELLYGKEGLKMGILMSQSGSFLVCGTLGIMTASYYAAENFSVKQLIKNTFSFPPFVAFCVALCLKFTGYHHPPLLAEILQKLGSPFSIIALISIGLQIEFSRESLQVKPLVWGLFFKLLLAPLIIFIIYVILFKQSGDVINLCIIGAALGPMNTGAIIAARFKLNPALATQMVGIGIPLSLVVVAVLHILIGG